MNRSKNKIHWSGGTRLHGRNKSLTKTLAGYPCCCSGYRAELIKARNDLTTDIEKVTCKSCLKLIDIQNKQNVEQESGKD